MKRALFLTYYLPPRQAIASVRAGHIVHALQSSGWEVIALTPYGDPAYGIPVHVVAPIDFKAAALRLMGARKGQTAHEHLHVAPPSRLTRPSVAQRVIAYGRQSFDYANGRFGWITHGTRAARELLAREKFDVIISTSPPEGTHLIAAAVHGDIPWLADLRDPWVRDDELASPVPLRHLDRILERSALRSASVITTVSEPLAEGLRARYPRANVMTLRNAFDRLEWEAIPFETPERATFLYAGQFYQGHRDPRPFLEALAHLLKVKLVRHEEVSVDFYGAPEAWLESEIARLGLRAVVHLRGKRSREEILRLERAASRLLVFCGNGPNEVGTYTAKLFEYFGARRTIIAAGGPEQRTVVDDALERTGTGRRYRGSKALRDAILDAVVEHRTGRAPIVSADAAAPFELRGFTQRFGEVLEGCGNAAAHGGTVRDNRLVIVK